MHNSNAANKQSSQGNNNMIDNMINSFTNDNDNNDVSVVSINNNQNKNDNKSNDEMKSNEPIQ